MALNNEWARFLDRIEFRCSIENIKAEGLQHPGGDPQYSLKFSFPDDTTLSTETIKSDLNPAFSFAKEFIYTEKEPKFMAYRYLTIHLYNKKEKIARAKRDLLSLATGPIRQEIELNTIPLSKKKDKKEDDESKAVSFGWVTFDFHFNQITSPHMSFIFNVKLEGNLTLPKDLSIRVVLFPTVVKAKRRHEKDKDPKEFLEMKKYPEVKAKGSKEESAFTFPLLELGPTIMDDLKKGCLVISVKTKLNEKLNGAEALAAMANLVNLQREKALFFVTNLERINETGRKDKVGQISGRLQWQHLPILAQLVGGHFRSGKGFVGGQTVPGALKPRIDGIVIELKNEQEVYSPRGTSQAAPKTDEKKAPAAAEKKEEQKQVDSNPDRNFPCTLCEERFTFAEIAYKSGATQFCGDCHEKVQQRKREREAKAKIKKAESIKRTTSKETKKSSEIKPSKSSNAVSTSTTITIDDILEEEEAMRKELHVSDPESATGSSSSEDETDAIGEDDLRDVDEMMSLTDQLLLELGSSARDTNKSTSPVSVSVGLSPREEPETSSSSEAAVEEPVVNNQNLDIHSLKKDSFIHTREVSEGALELADLLLSASPRSPPVIPEENEESNTSPTVSPGVSPRDKTTSPREKKAPSRSKSRGDKRSVVVVEEVKPSLKKEKSHSGEPKRSSSSKSTKSSVKKEKSQDESTSKSSGIKKEKSEDKFVIASEPKLVDEPKSISPASSTTSPSSHPNPETLSAPAEDEDDPFAGITLRSIDAKK